MPVFDSLANRMKFYEQHCSHTYLMPFVPAIVRLDGRNFHKFTSDLQRPFDPGFMDLMFDCTVYLVNETGAKVGYTQSDEITLVFYTDSSRYQLYLDARIDKINSLLAALTSVRFNNRLSTYLPSKVGSMPTFDCRCFSVPTKQEAVNCLLWREQDATCNSVQMLAQSYFKHDKTHGLSNSQLQEKQVNWNDLPASCKRGTYVKRQAYQKMLAQEDIDKLPEKARQHYPYKVGDTVERYRIDYLPLPPLSRVVNPVEVFFDDAKPVTKAELDEAHNVAG